MVQLSWLASLRPREAMEVISSLLILKKTLSFFASVSGSSFDFSFRHRGVPLATTTTTTTRKAAYMRVLLFAVLYHLHFLGNDSHCRREKSQGRQRRREILARQMWEHRYTLDWRWPTAGVALSFPLLIRWCTHQRRALFFLLLLLCYAELI